VIHQHHRWTVRQTDRQTDGQTDDMLLHDRTMHYSASHGKTLVYVCKQWRFWVFLCWV